jgi:hypothetical protein
MSLIQHKIYTTTTLTWIFRKNPSVTPKSNAVATRLRNLPCAPNDILRDDGGDPQKQAPLCRKVSPDPPARAIEDTLQSIVEEPSQSASVLDDEEDGDELDIQDLADALSTGVLPRTPVRSPSPKKPSKKNRKYELGLHSESVWWCRSRWDSKQSYLRQGTDPGDSFEAFHGSSTAEENCVGR